mmetsp:Transcript_11575/g.15662  ORF Transcript_11575/g.15662 Transcript_11575/m.15662 type:complete len:166 (-) Transcript_11575:73-570(-)
MLRSLISLFQRQSFLLLDQFHISDYFFDRFFAILSAFDCDPPLDPDFALVQVEHVRDEDPATLPLLGSRTLAQYACLRRGKRHCRGERLGLLDDFAVAIFVVFVNNCLLIYQVVNLGLVTQSLIRNNLGLFSFALASELAILVIVDSWCEVERDFGTALFLSQLG